LPTGAQAGIGARLLTGSYYGQTVQIWAALVAAAIIASLLIAIIDVIARLTARRMGASA
jgi:NitT/TauT family transport system permease protein